MSLSSNEMNLPSNERNLSAVEESASPPPDAPIENVQVQLIPEEMLRPIQLPISGAFPLTNRLIRNLPMIFITEREMIRYNCCIVCMVNFTVGEEVTILPCSHYFHFGCIKMWLLRSGSCPCCRTVVNRRYNIKRCKKMIRRALLQVMRIFGVLASELNVAQLNVTGSDQTEQELTREVVSEHYESSSGEENERSSSYDRNGNYSDRHRVTRVSRRRESNRAELSNSQSAQVVQPTSLVSTTSEQAEAVRGDIPAVQNGVEMQNGLIASPKGEKMLENIETGNSVSEAVENNDEFDEGNLNNNDQAENASQLPIEINSLIQ